jgi:hypothetical protein
MIDAVIIGVDPGDSMGLACFDNTKLIFALQNDPHQALTMLELACDKFKPRKIVIACERFTSGRATHSHQPTAQRVIGAVERLAKKRKIDFVLQGPADARAIAPDDLLRKLKLWQTSAGLGTPDANDANMAVRHALLLIATRYAATFEKMIRTGQRGT